MPLKRSGAPASYCRWRDTFAAAVVLLARRASLMLAAGIAALALGCATPTEVVPLYQAPTIEGAPYDRILILNVASSRQQQMEFETEIMRRLRDEGSNPFVAHRLLKNGGPVEQDDLDRVSAEVEADAILVTHIASLDTEVDVEEGRTDVISECRGGDPLDYFLYDHRTITEPDSVRIAHTVTVISNLYDARTRERLWTIQSTCFEKSTMPEVMLEEATAIVRQLKRDGLI